MSTSQSDVLQPIYELSDAVHEINVRYEAGEVDSLTAMKEVAKLDRPSLERCPNLADLYSLAIDSIEGQTEDLSEEQLNEALAPLWPTQRLSYESLLMAGGGTSKDFTYRQYVEDSIPRFPLLKEWYSSRSGDRQSLFWRLVDRTERLT